MNRYELNSLSIVKQKRFDEEMRIDSLLSTLRKDKEYAELENKKDSLQFEIIKSGALNVDIGDLKKEFMQVSKEYEAKLLSMGYTKSDLAPKYSCTLCNDTGIADGKLCKCVKNLAYSSQKESCALLKTSIDDFADVSNELIDEEQKENYNKLLGILSAFCQNFPNNKRKILGLSGGAGCGKTFLSSVVANNIMSKGYSVLFIDAFTLNDIFLRYYLAPIYTKEEILAPLIETDILMIDDLGTESFKNNVTEQVFLYLLSQRNQKHIFFTSNLDPDSLSEKYGQRIASRLWDKTISYIVPIKNSDIRLKIK